MTQPTIRIKVRRRSVVRGKALVRFPASVTVQNPLLLDRTGGNFEFGLDMNELSADVLLSGAGTATPTAPGTAAVGTSTKWAHEDHVHPKDSTKADLTYVDSQDALKAPLASPALTGVPTAPTASVGTSTTQLATTAFVLANGGSLSDYDTVAAVQAATIPAVRNFLRTAGYYAAGDKGGALYKRSSGTGAGKFSSAGGAVWEIAEKVGWVRQFGAKGDGVADDWQAITDCLTKFDIANFDEGNFRVTQTIHLTRNGQSLHGLDVWSSKITADGTNDCIDKVISLARCTVRNLYIDRVNSTSTTAVGVNFYQRGSMFRITNVYATNHGIGFKLGSTDDSLCWDCTAVNNYGDGFMLVADGSFGAVQWSMQRCLAQNNDGWGYNYVTNLIGYACGTMVNCNTYANTKGGLGAAGTPSWPIHSLRIDRCFIGGDGTQAGATGCLFLDTYGENHQITNCFFEGAGQSATGRNNATAFGNVGSGVYITVNNQYTQVANCISQGNSRHGFQCDATFSTWHNCYTYNNGINGVANAAGFIASFGVHHLFGFNSYANKVGIFNNGATINAIGGRLYASTTAATSGTITSTTAPITV